MDAPGGLLSAVRPVRFSSFRAGDLMASETEGLSFFDPFHLKVDAMREMLAEGRIESASLEDLALIWQQCKQITELVEQIAVEGDQLQRAVNAVGQAVKNECNRREHGDSK